ncbi:DNA alkylation repair protein [Microlunatus endophyticus]|uniref:DNA alkylation repair protein n=1 Tax=Microlunatus endophyticus TaxID=1716077 RepID=A0A917W3B5_9ACTN|nr:DNA alkylation repair protein [Microlunatus endophyticus]GGL58684.1 DNA alkylation repair protein [Microlunatus endophyticus]
MTVLSEVSGALEAAADPAAAVALARYFKTGPGAYGEGDRFIGIKVPMLRKIAKPYGSVPFDADSWLPLLRHPVHEYRLAALLAMTYRFARATPNEQAAIHGCYLDNMAFVNNWDLVDLSCRTLVGDYLLDRERDLLDELARSTSLWERRIAMVSTHSFILHGQTLDTHRIALVLIDDRHDLIHKAVGWMLREAGKRVSEPELLAFLDRHATALPRTALRYAIERLEPDVRRHYLEFR